MNSLSAYIFRIKKNTESLSEEQQSLAKTVMYVAVFASIYCVCNLLGKPQFASYAVLVFNLICYILGFVPKVVFFSSFVLGNELSSFINILAGLFFLHRKKMDRDALGLGHPPASIWVVTLLLLAITVINTLALGTFINAITSVVYYCFLGFLLYRLVGVYDKKEIRSCIVAYAYCEAILVLETALLYGFEPGDLHFGSLGNAHYLGVWCGMAIIALYACRDQGSKNTDIIVIIRKILPYGLLIFSLYLSDTKAPVLCGIAVVILALIVRRIFKTKTVIPSFLIYIACFMAIVLFLGTPIAKEALTKDDSSGSGFASTYLYSEYTSLKFDYFYDTVDSLLFEGRIITGYGLGQYGSRIANLYGYSFSHREDSAVNKLVAQLVESRMLDDYKKHASRYTDELVAEIHNYSAISVYPFSSLIALLAEGGVLGILLLCLILKWIHPNKDAQLILMFFVGCCTLDIYLDHIQLVGFLVLALATLRTGKENRFDV